MSSILSTGNRPQPLSHTHGSNRSSVPRTQHQCRTFHGRSPAKQRWAGKRHLRCTLHTLDHSSPAALTATAVILCRPAVSPRHRFLPDQCRFPSSLCVRSVLVVIILPMYLGSYLLHLQWQHLRVPVRHTHPMLDLSACSKLVALVTELEYA